MDKLRYDTCIDLSAKNNSHTQLILLTGRDKKVLEVGPATGYVTEVLKQRGCSVTGIEVDAEAAAIASRFCERMIIADIEEIDLEEALGEEWFDVIVFGDVLEHLVDPTSVLQRVRRLLAPEGYVVASIPNIAHGSVRLSLLTGEFRYTEMGLLDRTHLRFFTRESVAQLFREAGYSIKTWRRVELDPFRTEIGLREKDYPPYLAESIRAAEEAKTYQFVVKARAEGRLSPARAVRRRRDGSRSRLPLIWQVEDTIEENSRTIQDLRTSIQRKERKLEETRTALAEREEQIAEMEGLLDQANARAADAMRHLQLVHESVGYRVLELIRRVIRWLAPQGSARRRVLKLVSRGLKVLLTRGWRPFLDHLVHPGRWGRAMRTAPVAVSPPSPDHEYRLWLKKNSLSPSARRSAEDGAARLAYRPLISIVTPVYNPEIDWLKDAIESVRAQVYDNWELCLADDASTRPGVRDLLQKYKQRDERIKVVFLPDNGGIASASNAALALATGEFVGLLDHDDLLRPEALFEVVSLLNERRDLDFVFSDEDKQDTDGQVGEAFFKPDWSPDLLLSMNYVTHFAVYRKELLDRIGGFRQGYDGSQDYDLVLRATEITDRVAHISKPLYTWRKIPGSAAGSTEAKPYAYLAAKRALSDAMTRRGTPAEVVDGFFTGSYRIKYPLERTAKVSIIIPTRDRLDLLRRCIESIRSKSSYPNCEIVVVDNNSSNPDTLKYLESFPGRVVRYPHAFNFSRIVNFAAAEVDGDFLLFLNNDTQVISPGWIEAMVEQGQRPQVAAVGARLLFPDGRPQHEGIVVGLMGKAANLDCAGYFGLGVVVRNCSAVTAACLLTRREIFEELGGFDEDMAIAYNDVDFCLRAREKGYEIIYTPFAQLYHFESSSRGSLSPEQDADLFVQRWLKERRFKDPFYNANFDLMRPLRLRV